MEFLKEAIESIKSINWAISLLAAIPLSVIANLITPNISNWLASRSKERASERIKKIESQLEEIQKFADNRELLSNETVVILFRVLIAIALGSFTASILGPLFFAEPLAAIFFLDAIRKANNHITLINRCSSIDNYKKDIENQISTIEAKS